MYIIYVIRIRFECVFYCALVQHRDSRFWPLRSFIFSLSVAIRRRFLFFLNFRRPLMVVIRSGASRSMSYTADKSFIFPVTPLFPLVNPEPKSMTPRGRCVLPPARRPVDRARTRLVSHRITPPHACDFSGRTRLAETLTRAADDTDALSVHVRITCARSKT